MTEDFVEYEEALGLKSIGFDVPCIKGFYDKEPLYAKVDRPINFNGKKQLGELVSCPTYAQAFRWFRKVHGLHAEFHTFIDESRSVKYDFKVRYVKRGIYLSSEESSYRRYDDPENAAVICLKRLILNTNHLLSINSLKQKKNNYDANF